MEQSNAEKLSRTAKHILRFPRLMLRFPRLASDLSTPLVNIKTEKVRWLWKRRIPRRKVTILDGDPGLGKSLLMLDIAARITTGRKLPFGHPAAVGSVIILSAEDGAADTIRPRLEVAGADLNRISLMGQIYDNGEHRSFELPRDLDKLEAEIRRLNAVLVIIDPLMAYLPSTVNSWRDQDVRRALAPLAQVAERTGAAIVVIRHLNKIPGRNPLYRGGGSIGIIGAVRSGLLVAPDPEDPDIRVLASTKANVSARPQSLRFRITGNGAAAVQWLGASDRTAEELVDGHKTPASEAVAFLRRILKSGPKPSKKVKRLARRAGIALRTLDRAKGKLHVKAKKQGFGDEGFWVWYLPKKARAN